MTSTQASTATAPPGGGRTTDPAFALGAALLSFFVITLDALIVSVALPTIGADLGGGMTGLQWVVDGYTLVLAALLLSAGSISDRTGARQAFGVGMGLFHILRTTGGRRPGQRSPGRRVPGRSELHAAILESNLARQLLGDPQSHERARRAIRDRLARAADTPQPTADTPEIPVS